MNNKHPQLNEFEKFYSGTLPPSECSEFMNHISSCTLCAEKYAQFIEAKLVAELPLGTVENTKIKIRSIKRELLMYSFKVAVASVAAIVLVFVGAFSFNPPAPQSPKMEFANKATEQLSEFSQNILNGGIFNAEQKK